MKRDACNTRNDTTPSSFILIYKLSIRKRIVAHVATISIQSTYIEGIHRHESPENVTSINCLAQITDNGVLNVSGLRPIGKRDFLLARDSFSVLFAAVALIILAYMHIC